AVDAAESEACARCGGVVKSPGAQQRRHLMNPQRLFRDENLKLIELSQQYSFQFGDESDASLAPEVEHRHDDDLVEKELGISLPDASQGEFALLNSEAAKPR